MRIGKPAAGSSYVLTTLPAIKRHSALDVQRNRLRVSRPELQHSQTQQGCCSKHEVQPKTGDAGHHVRDKRIEDNCNSNECRHPEVSWVAGGPNRGQTRDGANDSRADGLNVCGDVPKGNSQAQDYDGNPGGDSSRDKIQSRL